MSSSGRADAFRSILAFDAFRFVLKFLNETSLFGLLFRASDA
jgi:hypothetical protein